MGFRAAPNFFRKKEEQKAFPDGSFISFPAFRRPNQWLFLVLGNLPGKCYSRPVEVGLDRLRGFRRVFSNWLWVKTNGIPFWGRCTTHFSRS